MFAIFQVDGKRKKRISDPYSGKTPAHDLCKRMNEQMEGHYIVRQRVKEPGAFRAQWQDL